MIVRVVFSSAIKRPLLRALAIAALVWPSAVQAETLTLLGSNAFTIEPNVTTANYSQSATTLTFGPSYALGDTLGGIFTTVYDWSDFSDSNVFTFGMLMSAPGASPGITFTVALFNGALDAIVNEYQGVAFEIGTTATFMPMELSAAGTGDLSSIGGLQFTWNGIGSGTVVVEGVAVVPEPSTWALLVLGALLLAVTTVRRMSSAR